MRGLWLAALVVGCSSSSSRADPPARVLAAPVHVMQAAALDELDITHGAIMAAADGLHIADPKVRAVVPGAAGDAAELRFVYAGQTSITVPLASGEVRQQVGLKLQAADGCNLIYVMWRMGEGVVVSIKRNPGQHTHAECGVRGYRNLPPELRIPIPAPQVGSAHRLEAAIDDGVLVARVDGDEVWRGRLDATARELRGPPGLRTDNVALSELELRVSFVTRAGLVPTPDAQ